MWLSHALKQNLLFQAQMSFLKISKGNYYVTISGKLMYLKTSITSERKKELRWNKKGFSDILKLYN